MSAPLNRLIERRNKQTKPKTKKTGKYYFLKANKQDFLLIKKKKKGWGEAVKGSQ